MLRLRSHNTAPSTGFVYIDKPTGFKVHAWSIRSAAASWYQEQLRRGMNVTIGSAMQDVERFTCEELMKTPHWNQWVMVINTPPPIPLPVLEKTPESNISVVIPVFESSVRLGKAMHAVHDQCHEVITVRDEEGKESGFGAKCNMGAKKSTSQFIWFLNDDCYPSPGCASHLLNVLTANPKIGMVGHLLRYPDGRIQHGGTYRSPDKVGFPHLDVGQIDPTIKVPTEMEAVTAASILVRREAFEESGGFDEGYFLYLEDSDLCLRMRSLGWKVYYTPFAEAIHEEHASSLLRSDLDQITKDSVARFQGKWGSYFTSGPPKFDSFEEVSKCLKIDAVYVHLVGHEGYEKAAQRFVDSVIKFPPGQDINWAIICNSPSGNQLSDHMKSVFSHLGKVTYFKHDNSGWDIGGFQAYSKTSTADFCLFLGGTAYARKKNWIYPMITAFNACGSDAMYGVCGNLGDQNCRVSPHLRTTGFWCSPKLFNAYPHQARQPEDRYPIEHGPQCLTIWCWANGYNVFAVDSDGIYNYPDWNNGPNGFHRGDQSSLLLGDRLTEPPYYANA